MRNLPPRVLRDIRGVVERAETHPVYGPSAHAKERLIAAIDGALKPKRSAKPARKRREKKKAAHREEIGAVREAVFDRAGGQCEVCELGDMVNGLPLELDHFFGGANRKALQSVKSCWALCRACHQIKTRGSPTPQHWLGLFIGHCNRHGYLASGDLARKRLESLQLQAQQALPR